MDSQEVVTPVNPGSGSGAGSGVQSLRKSLNRLGSGFRRNDGKGHFLTFYEIVNFIVFNVLFGLVQNIFMMNVLS